MRQALHFDAWARFWDVGASPAAALQAHCDLLVLANAACGGQRIVGWLEVALGTLSLRTEEQYAALVGRDVQCIDGRRGSVVARADRRQQDPLRTRLTVRLGGPGTGGRARSEVEEWTLVQVVAGIRRVDPAARLILRRVQMDEAAASQTKGHGTCDAGIAPGGAGDRDLFFTMQSTVGAGESGPLRVVEAAAARGLFVQPDVAKLIAGNDYALVGPDARAQPAFPMSAAVGGNMRRLRYGKPPPAPPAAAAGTDLANAHAVALGKWRQLNYNRANSSLTRMHHGAGGCRGESLSSRAFSREAMVATRLGARGDGGARRVPPSLRRPFPRRAPPLTPLPSPPSPPRCLTRPLRAPCSRTCSPPLLPSPPPHSCGRGVFQHLVLPPRRLTHVGGACFGTLFCLRPSPPRCLTRPLRAPCSTGGGHARPPGARRSDCLQPRRRAAIDSAQRRPRPPRYTLGARRASAPT